MMDSNIRLGGPAPLEPAAGVSLTAVRLGTGLGRPEPMHHWTEQPGPRHPLGLGPAARADGRTTDKRSDADPSGMERPAASRTGTGREDRNAACWESGGVQGHAPWLQSGYRTASRLPFIREALRERDGSSWRESQPHATMHASGPLPPQRVLVPMREHGVHAFHSVPPRPPRTGVRRDPYEKGGPAGTPQDAGRIRRPGPARLAPPLPAR
jgi:hypothetical protein